MNREQKTMFGIVFNSQSPEPNLFGRLAELRLYESKELMDEEFDKLVIEYADTPCTIAKIGILDSEDDIAIHKYTFNIATNKVIIEYE